MKEEEKKTAKKPEKKQKNIDNIEKKNSKKADKEDKLNNKKSKNDKTDKKETKKEIKKDKDNKKEIKKKKEEEPINVETDEKSLEKIKKEKSWTRFLKTIKQKWLVSRINTILLVVILIALCVFLNAIMRRADLTPIDCTTSKDYSLTKESKERISKVDKDVNIYFVGWDESNKDYELAKQYAKVNSKIKVELIDATKELDIAKKYEVSNEDEAIIVVSGETSRKLIYNVDIVSYDENYNAVDLIEQKLTSAILNVTSGIIPKVYYLTGYTNYTFTNGLVGFSQYLKDEVLTYEELNILKTSKVPDDCDTLIIMTPEKDFDETTTKAILDYIKKGGKILWFNGVYTKQMKLTNVNKILAEYGINSFEVGVVYETNSQNTILGYSTCFLPEVLETEITKSIHNSIGIVFLYANKINVNTDKLEELKVEKTDLILSSETTYFTTDLTNPDSKNNEKGKFLLGAEMTKTIDDNTKSELIIYGNDAFITDTLVKDGSGSGSYMIYIFNNADLPLNSIAHLTNKDQDITIRKSYSDSKTEFTPTDGQKTIIMIIIFAVPIIIILIGLIIWYRRKRRQ